MNYTAEEVAGLKFLYKKYESAYSGQSIYDIVSVAIDDTFVYPTDMTLRFQTPMGQGLHSDKVIIEHPSGRIAPDIDTCKLIVRKFTKRPMLKAAKLVHGFEITLGISGEDTDMSEHWGYEAMAKGHGLATEKNPVKPVETTAKDDDDNLPFGFN